MIIFVIFSLTLLNLPGNIESIQLPTRIQLAGSEPISPSTSISVSRHDETPPIISINEGDSLDVVTNSQSAITVNLNRAIQSGDIILNISAINDYQNLVLFNNSQVNSNASKSITLNYSANTFGDKLVKFYTGPKAGTVVIACKIISQPILNNTKVDDSTAFIDVKVAKSNFLITFAYVVGWLYFSAWSISFYSQVLLNYSRKSVVGLNFDFLALNIVGFTCYSIFYIVLLFSSKAQHEYSERHPYSRIPADYNDLFFGLHAVVITFLTIIQCLIYERGGQRVSKPAMGFITLVMSIGLVIYMVYLFNKIELLDLGYYLSYVKLLITAIKYIPQAYMNYERKATTGWSIHNILLDFSGGSLSIAQMFLLAYNYDDWASIFGNLSKFGLGMISMGFDLLFMVQHYLLYNQSAISSDAPAPTVSESVTNPVDDQPQQTTTTD